MNGVMYLQITTFKYYVIEMQQLMKEYRPQTSSSVDIHFIGLIETCIADVKQMIVT